MGRISNHKIFVNIIHVRKLQESSHEHPLIYVKRLTRTFRNYKGDVNGRIYKFKVCCFILDSKCSCEIFYEYKIMGFHQHPLVKYSFPQKKWGNEEEQPF